MIKLIRTILLTAMLCMAWTSVSAWDPMIFNGPNGKYRIIQQYRSPTGGENSGEDGSWDAILHFTQPSKPDAVLAAEPDGYPWPADYYISPNAHWILRIQKTGSGENSAFLYRVEASGRVWCAEQSLDDLAFGAATGKSRLTRDDYYHVGVEFVAWNPSKRLLQLVITGTPNEKGKPILERKVNYFLENGKMVAR